MVRLYCQHHIFWSSSTAVGINNATSLSNLAFIISTKNHRLSCIISALPPLRIYHRRRILSFVDVILTSSFGFLRRRTGRRKWWRHRSIDSAAWRRWRHTGSKAPNPPRKTPMTPDGSQSTWMAASNALMLPNLRLDTTSFIRLHLRNTMSGVVIDTLVHIWLIGLWQSTTNVSITSEQT